MPGTCCVVISPYFDVLDDRVRTNREHIVSFLWRSNAPIYDSLTSIVSRRIDQIGVFMTFFLFMFETYPYKVGIIKPLFKRFRSHMVVMAVYIIISAIHIANRNNIVDDLNEQEMQEVLVKLFDNKAYYAMFVLQKILAIPFYVAAINVSTTMTKPKYFSELYWIAYSRATRG